MAFRLDGEIVSADSMQVYCGMDIGTAKTPSGQRRVRYHCIDLVEPDEPYSAAVYQRDARSAIDDIAGRGRLPVVVGGTGLYLRAALDEFEFPPGEIDGELRVRLESRAEHEGGEALHAELATADPQAAARIHPNNVRRTIRALEMLALGHSYSRQAEGFGLRTNHYEGTLYVGLNTEREELYRRVDSRVDQMVRDGLLEEVRHLLDRGYGRAITAMQAIGYKELLPVLTAGAPLGDAIASIKQSSRRYAKRQLTWLRADKRVRWLDVTGSSTAEAADAVAELLESSAHLA